MDNAKKILFLTHDTSRTGAPIVLLHLLKWLKKNTALKIVIFSLKGGALKTAFTSIADEFNCLADIRSIRNIPSFVPMKHWLRNRAQKDILRQLGKVNFDLIYANTALTVELGKTIKDLSSNQPKFIAHIHELNSLLQQQVPNFKSLASEPDYFIAVSNLVRKNLKHQYSIPDEKIKVIYEFSTVKVNSAKPSTKKKLVIGGAGTASRRKGVDLFLQVAQYCKEKYPDLSLHFNWVGKVPKQQFALLEADITKANLEKNVTFLGEQINPETYFQEFDVFLLTSREDPFPLVCIEIGLLGKPIICFEQATGITEVLSNGGGFIVPYLSISTMGDRLKYYADHPEQRIKDGTINTQQFASFVPEVQCPKIYQVITELLTYTADGIMT